MKGRTSGPNPRPSTSGSDCSTRVSKQRSASKTHARSDRTWTRGRKEASRCSQRTEIKKPMILLLLLPCGCSHWLELFLHHCGLTEYEGGGGIHVSLAGGPTARPALSRWLRLTTQLSPSVRLSPPRFGGGQQKPVGDLPPGLNSPRASHLRPGRHACLHGRVVAPDM